MKDICIINDIKWSNRPFDLETTYDQDQLRFAYEVLSTEAKKQNARFVMTNLDWFDQETDSFKKGWEFKDNKWNQIKDISYDYIFDKYPTNKKTLELKNYFNNKGIMVNELEFEDFCYDKAKTQEFLKEFSPKSFEVKSQLELCEKLKEITTEKVVIKPTIGSGAYGVEIVSKQDAYNLEILEPSLLQEYVESKQYPTHGDYGVFDMRFFVSNGEILTGYYRFSKPGVLTSNVSTGGRVEMFRVEDIDSLSLDFVKTIDNMISQRFSNRFYAIDIVIDPNDKLFLIELNSKAGFWVCEESEMRLVCESLVKLFN
jgi:glutathione synthase/RimK-type ligase-like ATP-grasp enzyme